MLKIALIFVLQLEFRFILALDKTDNSYLLRQFIGTFDTGAIMEAMHQIPDLINQYVDMELRHRIEPLME
jgi:hypothetical protein